MDLSKMYHDISVQSSLNSHTLEDFVQKNAAFVQALNNDLGKIGPYEVADALSFLLYAKPYFTSAQEWEKLAIRCLEIVRDGIYKQEFRGIYVCFGLSYVCFLVRELANKAPAISRFRDSLEYLFANTLRSYLDATNERWFESESTFELIFGFSGVLRCCCDGEPDSPCLDLADEVADALVRRLRPKTFLGWTVPGFHYIPSRFEAENMGTLAPNGCVNYSMSHGIAGTLGPLSFAYRKRPNSDVRKTMEVLIAEFLHARYYVDGVAYWPGRITIEQYLSGEQQRFPSRMSWCYGSPGILRALYLAADALSIEDIKRFSVNEMAKIATMDTSKYLFDSPIVCHGLAGVALVMRSMYNDTQNGTFADKAREITDMLVYNFAYQEKENCNLTGTKKVWKYNYLEGYTGILQTIYTVMTGEPNMNEKRLMLR